MSQAMIQVRNVSKSYQRGGETLKVLDGLELDMQEGRFYALMGPSGSGKTTLLNLIGGLDQPDSGELFVAGEQPVAVLPSRTIEHRAPQALQPGRFREKAQLIDPAAPHVVAEIDLLQRDEMDFGYRLIVADKRSRD